MKAWWIEKHGGPEVLEQKDLPKPTVRADEVVIRVAAVALNHLDLWVRNGVPGHHFPLPLIPGCDVAGTIEDPGSAKEFKKGDRVLVDPIFNCGKCRACQEDSPATCKEFGLVGETTHGGCAEFIAIRSRNLLKIPSAVSFEDAVSLPIAYITAWRMIHQKAKLQSHETILIHAGGSGVSVAATQIAKMVGATVITTVGSAEKEEKSKKAGSDFVIRYQETPFRDELKKIMKSRGQRGVDVAIDHVGEETFWDSIRSLNWGGRLVTCGATTGAEVKIDLKPIFFKNLSIFGSTMGSQKDLRQVLAAVEQGQLKPVIDSIWKFSELPKAMSRLENRESFGKVLVLF